MNIMSNEIDKLCLSMVKFQGSVGNIPKTKMAKIPMKSGSSYSYLYADLAEISDRIRDPLKNNGLWISQIIQEKEGTEKAYLITILFHESGQYIKSSLPLPMHQDKFQELGGAITYLRRYCLISLLGLCADEDNDAEDSTGRPQSTTYREFDPPKPDPLVNKEQIQILNGLTLEFPTTFSYLLTKYSLPNLEFLKQKDYDHVIKVFDTARNKRNEANGKN